MTENKRKECKDLTGKLTDQWFLQLRRWVDNLITVSIRT